LYSLFSSYKVIKFTKSKQGYFKLSSITLPFPISACNVYQKLIRKTAKFEQKFSAFNV